MLKIFKVGENAYRVRGDGEVSSMLSRYGILCKDGEAVEECDAVSVGNDSVCFAAGREVRISLDRCGSKYTVKIPLTENERIFGLADANRENIMIRGMRITLWKENVKCYGGMPILLSSDGWAILLNTTYKTEFDIRKGRTKYP